MLHQLDNLARQLRAAMLASDHEKAARLTVAYTQSLRQYGTLLSPEDRSASGLPQQSLELLKWVREMTLVQQAMAAGQLAMVERASRQLAARALYLQSATA